MHYSCTDCLKQDLIWAPQFVCMSLLVFVCYPEYFVNHMFQGLLDIRWSTVCDMCLLGQQGL